MNKKLLFTLTLSALLFTSCGQSGSKQDATTTDTTTTEAAAPEKVKIDENDAESLAENGGYPPTQNGDIRSLFWLFSLMALQN